MRATLFVLIISIGSIFSVIVHAEGNCPPGYYPIGGQGIQGCAPIPGYDQQQPSPAPAAPSPQWKSRWGAIATDGVKGVLGTAIGMADQLGAEKTAMADCLAKGGSTCKIQLSYANGCAAMIVGNRGFSTANGSTKDEAIKKGTKICSADGDTGCHIYYTACSHPQQMQ